VRIKALAPMPLTADRQMSMTASIPRMHCSAPIAEKREFVFTGADFERIRRMIREKAGICLSATKHEMVYSRLARRLRVRGLGRFSEYVALLERRDPEECEAFVNALTTNLTSFFREAHHFAALARHVDVLRREAHPHVAVWCCAASTGEEAYSIAMTMVETFGTYTPPVSIVATDVDTHVLATAEAGAYPAERLSMLDEDRIRRFFVREVSGGEAVLRVRPELRKLVTFRQVNLLRPPWRVRGPFDAIFCRNVMIYFDKPTQRGIVEGLTPLLRPDGLLFTGHSESLVHSADLVKLRGNTVYERAPVAA
jgi:chemotaxis protein methyltransferase CheR